MDEKQENLEKAKKIYQNTEKSHQQFNSKHHSMTKRSPSKPYQRENDIYITTKSNFKGQIKKCEEILDSELGEVFLHCLGNSITRGINLAITLEKSGLYKIEPNTSTVNLIDDFHPLRDDDDFAVQKRLNSCLHIRVYRHTKTAKITL